MGIRVLLLVSAFGLGLESLAGGPLAGEAKLSVNGLLRHAFRHYIPDPIRTKARQSAARGSLIEKA
ncbi:hypothetical protein XH90_13540 [Bradyrhizobium sp. CCBAU 53338]|nr:hypothetical protein XH90_13540 [Bradyrhizobium sp. CCBAU 53338]